jgi:uncharacterized protein HemY
MTQDDTVDLLLAMAVYDGRILGDTDSAFWYQHLASVDYQDAERAVHEHYGESTDRMMPAHVKRRVAAIRAERLRRERQAVPAADPDDVQAYLSELRRADQEIAQGDVPAPLAGIARRVLASRPEASR